jgi:glycosyltransferase involved in cell wall biosynthesis
MVGKRISSHYDGITLRHASLDTESPANRIVWEQVFQPAQLPAFDLYHAMAFVSPLLNVTPTVVTVYDLTFMRYPERLPASRRLYLRLFTALSCHRARRITAISHSTAHDLTHLLGIPASKIDVTPLGYDQEAHFPRSSADIAAFKSRHGLPERFWLFIGTIEPRKNLPMLLDAYAQLPTHERLPLLLGGGKGWGIAEVEAKIQQHGLQESVKLIGFIPPEDLPLWYNSAEVFLYPSVFEGFGLPVLEAMACGTPVMTSNVSSLPEVAQNAGLCLPPNNVDAWAQALSMAFRDAAWRHSARERGLEDAQHFNWQDTARLTMASYQKALGRTSADAT